MKNIKIFILVFAICNFSFTYLLAEDNLNNKIYKNLRCLICQGQSIADSNSDYALTVKSVVDDKINEKAREKKVKINEITEETIKWFHEDMDQLEALRPTSEPRATNYISQMITMIVELISKAYAYPTEDGHVFFSVEKFDDYGRLSNKDLDELVTGSKIENEESKKNPLDFVLWKPSDEKDPGWDSPWGRGRPGWHLECSVMSERYLGKEFDIHGGGLDLVFPHHENEIAQSCSNNSNNKMANYWVHNGFLTMNKEKMSKSLGNIVSITDALKHYNGQVLRLALLSSHYKQPLDWNEKLLDQQKNTLDKWYSLYEENYSQKKIPHCFESLLDDLNTPEYISKLHELYNESVKGDRDKQEAFNYACRLIGIFNENKKSWENYKKKSVKISEKNIISKINERLEARKKGDFKLADKIRIELLNEGVLIEDKKDKTNWKYK